MLDVAAYLTFQGQLYYPNYAKGDFSNFETNTFQARIYLSVGYDKDKLFKPISAEVSDIDIQ